MSKVKEVPQRLSDDKVLALYGGFSDDVAQVLRGNAEMLDFVAHFPTLAIYPVLDANGVPSGKMVVHATPSDVADYITFSDNDEDVKSRSLTQKAKQDEDLIPYLYAPQVSYPLFELLHAGHNMGKVSKGRVTFENVQLAIFFATAAEREAEIAAMYSAYDEDYIPYDAKVEYENAMSIAGTNYATYRDAVKAETAAKKAATALEELAENSSE